MAGLEKQDRGNAIKPEYNVERYILTVECTKTWIKNTGEEVLLIPL